MKKIKLILFIWVFLTTVSGYTQYNLKSEYNNIQLSNSKTTSILFPYAVKSLDIGSRDVLVQKAKGVENVLLLKAGKQNFQQTNLTVVTSDGKLYSFILNFDDLCPTLNIDAGLRNPDDKHLLFSMENENQKEIKDYAMLALSKKNKVSRLSSRRSEIELKVDGIFIHQDIMYFRVFLGNDSKINYDVDQLRFFIRDQRKSKRTASQEIEIIPLFNTGDFNRISDNSENTAVFALPKFTIPEKKKFTMQVFEKNGGRHLELNIKNRNLVNLEILGNL
ncbi:conjugative transposon protein TraN [Flavobacterium plurextorum]|uniref:conjugative transposon protein TraN n=1 Tax=Flavobacterium TaxID=237 RepID=UPI00214DE492|nr:MULTISPECIES: conjugative transposon protein TraN [Flavobacterium]UUW11269.1 conjugative transposon protein TraN [Flavobacterium plurextorum]